MLGVGLALFGPTPINCDHGNTWMHVHGAGQSKALAPVKVARAEPLSGLQCNRSLVA